MKIALLGNNKEKFDLVFCEEVIGRLRQCGEISDGLIGSDSLERNKDFLADCEVAFSTWGMPELSEAEIQKYMPRLKCVFYAAGSVQYFAKPFLNCNIRVFSAYAANAVPVIEYTVSQILLASKGFYQGTKRYRLAYPSAVAHTQSCKGNFGIKIGLVGLGTIGSGVAEKLGEYDVEVLAYDPFCSKEKAEQLGVRLTDLETIFSECLVISNHLANKKELKNIFNGKLFGLMQKHSTFINTGRGDQVDEWALAKSLILHPSRTAVLDVLKKERIPYINPLFWCPNAVITPHIAGSMGNETHRMAYYMLEELERYSSGKETRYEVTKEMLKAMA
ncbi:MAG: hydroxyacid dehydrogenase [Clostridia bacterium]|nr:hydroxyacid dehydrogenase [Clostridia bacterium]